MFKRFGVIGSSGFSTFSYDSALHLQPHWSFSLFLCRWRCSRFLSILIPKINFPLLVELSHYQFIVIILIFRIFLYKLLGPKSKWSSCCVIDWWFVHTRLFFVRVFSTSSHQFIHYEVSSVNCKMLFFYLWFKVLITFKREYFSQMFQFNFSQIVEAWFTFDQICVWVYVIITQCI